MDPSIQKLKCRVCDSQELLINIFIHEAHNIVEKLCFCASVQVSEHDGLPQHICTKCYADLEIAYVFRKRCEENDAKLRSSLNALVKEEFTANNVEPAITNSNEELDEFEEQYVTYATTDSENGDGNDKKQRTKRKLPKTYTCETCGSVFSEKRNYFDHIRAHGDKRFRCKTCLKYFSRKAALIRHELGHLGKRERVPCDQCPLDFSCRAALLRHIAGVHEKRRDFVCTLCGHGFSQKTGLQAHQSVHITTRYKCSKCDATFKNLRFFKRHEQRHLPPSERDPKLMFTSTSNNSYKQSKRIYVCSYCGKTSNIHNDHIIHERSHSGERPYPCIICGKAFNRSAMLKRHIRTHTGERAHKCETCGKCFREKAHLTTHNLTHTQERKYICQICSKAFALKCTLKSHLKGHAVCGATESVQ